MLNNFLKNQSSKILRYGGVMAICGLLVSCSSEPIIAANHATGQVISKDSTLPKISKRSTAIYQSLKSNYAFDDRVHVVQIMNTIQVWLPSDALFKVNTTTLKTNPKLLHIYDTTLADYSGLSTVVECLTDSSGTAEQNLKLSFERAKAVEAYLVGAGIDAKHIQATGYGDQFPRASNQTPEGRALNRRIVLTISHN